MFAVLTALFGRPVAPTPTVRLTVRLLESREAPADVGWVMGGPQPDPPGKSAVQITLAPVSSAVQSIPPRPAAAALVPPAPGW